MTLNIALVPQAGVYGAILATAISYLLVDAWYAYCCVGSLRTERPRSAPAPVAPHIVGESAVHRDL